VEIFNLENRIFHIIQLNQRALRFTNPPIFLLSRVSKVFKISSLIAVPHLYESTNRKIVRNRLYGRNLVSLYRWSLVCRFHFIP